MGFLLCPSEEFLRVKGGSDFGWPYCYYDQIQEKKVLAPEYGGDGDALGRCSDCDLPIMGFPGHWAPNDLYFYRGDQFPEHYKNGAFIAFHGSTNRAPYPQAGYFVGFIPFVNGEPTGEWEVFADGFPGVDPIVSTGNALFRPMGIAMGPDGSLYVSESRRGKIWRIMYKGEKAEFGIRQLAKMEEHKTLSHIRTPDKFDDHLQKETVVGGEKLFLTYCSPCHQRDGRGSSGRFPSLAGTDWVTGDKGRLISAVLNGLSGSIDVNGEIYNGVMPPNNFLGDEEMASILTFIRQSFGNNATEISPNEVGEIRAGSS